MNIREEAVGSLVHLHFEGELTIYHVDELKQRLVGALNRFSEIELHMAGVSEIDSSGFQVLIMAKLESVLKGKLLKLTDHSAAVVETMELFDMVGFFGDPLLIQSRSA